VLHDTVNIFVALFPQCIKYYKYQLGGRHPFAFSTINKTKNSQITTKCKCAFCINTDKLHTSVPMKRRQDSQ